MSHYVQDWKGESRALYPSPRNQTIILKAIKTDNATMLCWKKFMQYFKHRKQLVPGKEEEQCD